MYHNRIRPLHGAGLTLLCLALLAAPVWATCGGGGGGGRGGAGQAYKTNWMTSWKKTLSDAELKEQGVLLYFQPRSSSEHRFFKTKWPNDVSKERFFYKVRGASEEAQKMRAEYRVEGKKHHVFICDWHGNVFKSFATTDRAKFRSGALKGPLYGIQRSVKRLRKKIAQNTVKAEKALKKESYPTAIKALKSAQEYTGYPEVEQSKKLWQQLEKEGLSQLEAALKLENPERRRKLNALKRTFKQTGVEKAAAKALAKEDGKREASVPAERAHDDATMKAPSLAERICAELFVDDGSTTIAELVDAAVQEGLRHENAARYEDALRAYERAVRLDPKDPVPLVYLGELHRHHMGRWDDAERAFRRVLELDGQDHAVAVALHGIGKMTIWRGDNEAGLKLLAGSIERSPTALCYRNLAVYWNTEGDAGKAFAYATKAYELEPRDSYNQVFYSVYLLLNGRAEEAQRLMAAAEFDPSMSYNYACYHAVRGDRDQVLAYLKRHFYEYEKYAAVRSFEMAEARMDGFFARWLEDPEFKQVTKLAGKTPWLREG